jgi:hypothetical protein
VILDAGLEEFDGLTQSASAGDPELLCALLAVGDEELSFQQPIIGGGRIRR